ncbi:BZ3500_MvSof-1268-A1-R1_Chr2-2g05134 [Microbotryum saponariae]|uniref:BZ3500_MvSof-1268-A1-R1_Chr2-2g05134 protein n=1 Tax=Microbotryum saponariae TaxID=289078 RepID=A0A2X0L308_9BASI|nr:BZ3500_MvSof-1268-A1-R1_Chr2-2g05134 [Microbotryum saponariae]SDA00961.1 BZ3501_MvSof-1269-A2-R1_Chr2-2g04808 [Microbotryum saponariae]
MPVRFCTLFVSLERQCSLPLHSRNFSTLSVPAMTTASTSTNDHAATAPQLPPMQLSGALDTTACTTYDGALFRCREAGLVFDGCLPRTHIGRTRAVPMCSLSMVAPMTASTIVRGAQLPSEMFDRHSESVAMRTCDSNWYIMRKYDLMARAMERPVDDLIQARGRIQAMEAATLGDEDWKPILPLLKPVVVRLQRWRVCITNLSLFSCRAVTSASCPRIASRASVLWFRGRIPRRSRLLTSAPANRCSGGLSEHHRTAHPRGGQGSTRTRLSRLRLRFSLPARLEFGPHRTFHDAMYKIVTPLDAGAFEAKIKALAKVPHVAPYLAAIPKQIREGFDFGIKDPPSERHIAKNAPLSEEQQLVMDGEMERMLDLGYIAGPYDKDELEAAVGPFRTNPISYAKPIVRTTDPDEANHPSTSGHGPSQRNASSSRPKLVSINDDLKSADFPCRWTTLPMLYRKFRELPLTAEVCGWDFADAFYQLPLRWDQRSSMCILWRGLIFVRRVPCFGGRTTPGVFGNVADLTQDLQKGFTWTCQFFHVGIDWDLVLMTARVTDQKRMRYIDALVKGSCADQKERSEVESVTGSLGYVAYILPALRTHLNCLYRQCIAHGDRKAVSRARRLDRRTYDQLEYWRRSLSSEGPFSTSFEALPIPSKLALAWDACMHGLGIVINGYSAYFALPEGWTDLPPPRHSVSITDAEAWAVEALAEAALRMSKDDRHFVLQCDNTGVVLGWRKGHSMNPLLNSSLSNLRSLEETRGVKWSI